MAYTGPDRRASLPEKVDREQYDVTRLALQFEEKGWLASNVRFRRSGDSADKMRKGFSSALIAIVEDKKASPPTVPEVDSDKKEDRMIGDLDSLYASEVVRLRRDFKEKDRKVSGKIAVVNDLIRVNAKRFILMMVNFLNEFHRFFSPRK